MYIDQAFINLPSIACILINAGDFRAVCAGKRNRVRVWMDVISFGSGCLFSFS